MVSSEDRKSTEFGEIPIGSFMGLWNSEGVERFRYLPIRIVPILIIPTLLALWAYYVYTAQYTVGLTIATGMFGLVLLVLSVWVALRLNAWRLFVKRSGVVTGEDGIAWRNGPRCYYAPWRLIEPDALGIERMAMEKGYDRFLTIKVGDSAEPLYVIRLYARLDNTEGFLAVLLKRIPREKWKKAAKKMRAGQR